MKKQYSSLIFIVVSILGAAMAHADVPSVQESPDFWKKLNNLVSQCAVKPYTVVQGVKAYGPLRSLCQELHAEGNQAEFVLDGETFSAQMQESADSDGGDLDDISVQNSQGAAVAQRQNVLAYDDVLLGLAGGDVNSREVYAP